MSDFGSFVPNVAGIAEVLGSGTARRGLTAAGEAITEASKANAPVGHDERGVHYQDTLHTGSPYIGEGGELVVEVYSTDYNAALIEFGSVNNPPYRPITHGAQACGLSVDDPGPQ